MTTRRKTAESGLTFAMLAAANHHTVGLIVGAVVVVLTTLVPVFTTFLGRHSESRRYGRHSHGPMG